MARATQDIYRSRERAEPEDADRRTLVDEAAWVRRMSRNRITTAVFVVSMLIFLALLVGIIFFQQNLIRGARQQTAAAGGAEPLRPYPTLNPGLDVDPAGRVVFDELADITPMDIPAEGELPLTVAWVKQAAYHLRRGEKAYREERWADAASAYADAARILPGVSGVSASIGLCHLRLEDYPAAEAAFRAEIDGAGATPALLNDLGVAQMGQERYEEAEASFVAAVGGDPAYVPARQNLGLLQYRTGRMEEAAATLATLAETAPDNVDAANLRAMALIKLDRWEEAAEVLQANSEKMPGATSVNFRLAEALSHTGRNEAAILALRKAVSAMDTRTALALLNRKEFELLREQPGFQELVAELSRPLP